MKTYTIGEVSTISGFKTHTLRYYESKNIVRSARDKNNNRAYSNKDIKWLELLVVLKEMGLSLNQLKEYSKEYYRGTSKNNVVDILLQQQKMLSQQQTTITNQLEQINNKLIFLKQSKQNVDACQNRDLTGQVD